MKNPTEHQIHELHANRWSPYSFDPRKDISNGDLRALFEAARWTMSSYGEQPWRYIVGVKSHNLELWQRIHDVLLEGNQPWAQHAPVLVVAICENFFSYNGKANKAAEYDLGAASASLTFEATARGIAVHQMIGIDTEKAHIEFSITEGCEVVTALAIGYAGDNPNLADEYKKRDQRPRERKTLTDIILEGKDFLR